MAKIEQWEEAWGPMQELREWAFQEWRGIEVRQEDPISMGIAAGKLAAFAFVVVKIDEMAERASAARSASEGT